MIDQIKTFCRIQFKRHLSNPLLWVVALAAPIAAKYMVPSQGDDYAVLSINGAYPILTSGVIGMQLGIIAALLLSPLIYIFLRIGRITVTPWQVEDVTPAKRYQQMLGHWLADTAILWILLLGLALSGVILAYFRLPFESVNPFETVTALMTIAAPAFCFIAAIRLFFSARPLLRGAWGDVLFFVLWMFGVVMGSIFFSMQSSAIVDLFGYAAPMRDAVDVPIDMYAVGSSTMTTETIKVDAMKGILTGSFLLSRVFWIGMGATLAVIAGFAYKARKPKATSRKKLLTLIAPLFVAFEGIIQRLLPKSARKTAPLWTNISQILCSGAVIALCLLIAVAGFGLPFRGAVGPALLLVMLFPLTRQSGAWQNRTLSAFAETLPTSSLNQLIWQALAGIFIMTLLCVPSVINIFISDTKEQLLDVFVISVIIPVFIVILGHLSKTGITARLLGLIGWYAYLNA